MVVSKRIMSLEFNHLESLVFERNFKKIPQMNYCGNYRISSGLWNISNLYDVIMLNISPYNYRLYSSLLQNSTIVNDCKILFITSSYFEQLSQFSHLDNVSILLKPLHNRYLCNIIRSSNPQPSPQVKTKDEIDSKYLLLVHDFKHCSEGNIQKLSKEICLAIAPFPESDIIAVIDNCKDFLSLFLFYLTNDANDLQITQLTKYYNSFLKNIKSISRISTLLKKLEQYLIQCYSLMHPHYISIDQERIEELKYRINQYIDNELDFSLESIAMEMHISTSYLSRMFNKIEHINYKEYILIQRFKKACHLLQSTNQTIEEIALQCGYRECSSFSRAFKNQYDLSPMAFRKQSISKKNNLTI